MIDEAIVIIVIMVIITTLLLVGLPIIFPDMIPDNVKKHIDNAVPTGNYNDTMPPLQDGYNR